MTMMSFFTWRACVFLGFPTLYPVSSLASLPSRPSSFNLGDVSNRPNWLIWPLCPKPELESSSAEGVGCGAGGPRELRIEQGGWDLFITKGTKKQSPVPEGGSKSGFPFSSLLSCVSLPRFNRSWKLTVIVRVDCAPERVSRKKKKCSVEPTSRKKATWTRIVYHPPMECNRRKILIILPQGSFYFLSSLCTLTMIAHRIKSDDGHVFFFFYCLIEPVTQGQATWAIRRLSQKKTLWLSTLSLSLSLCLCLSCIIPG